MCAYSGPGRQPATSVEDDGTENNQVATIALQESPVSGFRSSVRYSHYSLLSTIEQAWGLSSLTSNDAGANVMADFFTTPTATAPSAPTSASAVAGTHGRATLSWSAPSSTGGCPISSYSVTPNPGTGVVSLVSGSATSAVITGLTRGTTYTFTVTATNCAFAGPASAPTNPVTIGH